VFVDVLRCRKVPSGDSNAVQRCAHDAHHSTAAGSGAHSSKGHTHMSTAHPSRFRDPEHLRRYIWGRVVSVV
jgi:hypothetical protein